MTSLTCSTYHDRAEHMLGTSAETAPDRDPAGATVSMAFKPYRQAAKDARWSALVPVRLSKSWQGLEHQILS